MKKLRLPLLLAFLCLSLPLAANYIYGRIKARQERSYDSILKKPVHPVRLKRVAFEPFTNTVGMTLVYIPPGKFVMGSPKDEIGRGELEVQHEVIISKGFYLQTTEVTQKQWTAVMGRNPSHFKGADLPVEQVSWYDSQIFIQRLNQMEEGGRYRLPTEAEWEYACRAGTVTAFVSGPITHAGRKLDPALDRIGWYWANSNGSSHPVAQKEANAWGLYDMHGNVWEWCQDWFQSWFDKFTAGPVIDPQGPKRGRFRVFRGGSWFAGAEYLRSADRLRSKPDFRSYGLGFRLAWSD